MRETEATTNFVTENPDLQLCQGQAPVPCSEIAPMLPRSGLVTYLGYSTFDNEALVVCDS